MVSGCLTVTIPWKGPSHALDISGYLFIKSLAHIKPASFGPGNCSDAYISLFGLQIFLCKLRGPESSLIT